MKLKKDRLAQKLLRKAQSGNPSERKEAAFHPKTPLEGLLLLARDEDEWIRCILTANPALPFEVFLVLLRDPSPEVRKRALAGAKGEYLGRIPLPWEEGPEALGLARNPETPGEVLLRLARSPDQKVRYWTAQNPNLPKEAVPLLLGDPAYAVRMATLWRAPLPEEVFREFFRKGPNRIRTLLLENPHCPRELLVEALGIPSLRKKAERILARP